MVSMDNLHGIPLKTFDSVIIVMLLQTAYRKRLVHDTETPCMVAL